MHPLVLAWAKAHPDIQAVYDGRKTTKGVRSLIRAFVFVVKQKQSLADVAEVDRIPATFGGIPTDVVENTYKALDVNTARRRPCPAGFSFGHVKVTAGTFGLPVKYNGEWLALTNNHVAANSNQALLGDSILQPGSADGGALPAWGKLVAFHPIRFMVTRSLWDIILDWILRRTPLPPTPVEPNRIDAALVLPVFPEGLLPIVVGLGPVTGFHRTPTLDLPVQKVGRTTGHTTGTIVGINGFVRVSYGSGGTAEFVDQIIIESGEEFSAGGDSGSAILTMDNKVVGLLYAGGDGQTIANRIADVITVWPDISVL